MAMLQLDDIEGCLLESSGVELANEEMTSMSLSAGQANLQRAVMTTLFIRTLCMNGGTRSRNWDKMRFRPVAVCW